MHAVGRGGHVRDPLCEGRNLGVVHAVAVQGGAAAESTESAGGGGLHHEDVILGTLEEGGVAGSRYPRGVEDAVLDPVEVDGDGGQVVTAGPIPAGLAILSPAGPASTTSPAVPRRLVALGQEG